MYSMIAVVFAITGVMAVAAIIKFGFNFILLYILLFSAACLLWSIAAISREKGKNDNG